MFGLRRDELRRVLPIAIAYALVLASLYVLKPARNALFLDSIGVSELPYVLVLVALVGGVGAWLYGRYASRVRIDRLIFRTYLVLMAVLVLFRVLIPLGQAWVFYAFYVWVALHGLLSTSLIWLLANAVFTAREARRLFGFIGTGGIAGAILGGAVTGQIASVLGTEDLLFACVGILAVVLLIIRTVRVVETQEKRKQDQAAGGGIDTIWSSDLLRSLALVTGLIAVVAVVVDIQFNEFVDRSIVDKDAKTAFFGQFFAYLSAFGFIFQLVATPWILRSLGVGAAILILPVAMGLGSAAILIVPGLLAAILAKGADGGFRHSVHKAGSEVLFLPVPAGAKKQAKLFLDTTVDTFATGVGAGLVLLLTGPLEIGYRWLSVLTVIVTFAVVLVTFRLRRAYVDAFRKGLENQKIDLSDLTVDLTEAGAINALLPWLDSDNDRQVLYILDILSSARSKQLVEPLVALLDHPSAEVRRRALVALSNQKAEIPASIAERLLADPEPPVRLETLYALSQVADHPAELLRSHIAQPELRSSVLGCIARSEAPEVKALITPALAEELLQSEDIYLRGLAGRAIATCDGPALRPYLLRLTHDPSPTVQAETIGGIAEAQLQAFVPFLVERIADRALMRPARQALASFGDAAIDPLEALMSAEETTLALRRSVPRVLGEIGDQRAVDLLMVHMYAADSIVRANVAKAMLRLRRRHPQLRFDRPRIEEAIHREARKLYFVTSAIATLEEGDQPSRALLVRALREKRAAVCERAFHLLGIRHRPEEMENAYQGFVSAQPRMRAAALEFLDNVVEKSTRTHLLPLLEPTEQAQVIAAGRALFGAPLEDRVGALTYLLEGDDPWLCACALFELRDEAPDTLRTMAATKREDPDPIVRETAEFVMTHLESC